MDAGKPDAALAKAEELSWKRQPFSFPTKFSSIT